MRAGPQRPHSLPISELCRERPGSDPVACQVGWSSKSVTFVARVVQPLRKRYSCDSGRIHVARSLDFMPARRHRSGAFAALIAAVAAAVRGAVGAVGSTPRAASGAAPPEAIPYGGWRWPGTMALIALLGAACAGNSAAASPAGELGARPLPAANLTVHGPPPPARTLPAAAAVRDDLLRWLRRSSRVEALASRRQPHRRPIHLLRVRRLPARPRTGEPLPRPPAPSRQLRHRLQRQRGRRPRDRPPDQPRLRRGQRDRYPLQRPLLRSLSGQRRHVDDRPTGCTSSRSSTSCCTTPACRCRTSRFRVAERPAWRATSTCCGERCSRTG